MLINVKSERQTIGECICIRIVNKFIGARRERIVKMVNCNQYEYDGWMSEI